MAYVYSGYVTKVVTDKGELPVDMVVMAIGVRPATKLVFMCVRFQ